jgi:hypothetical protein
MLHRVWLHLNKESLQGPEKKIKSPRYVSFYILEKVDNNAYRLSLAPYMCIYSVVNVGNLELYKPSMLNDDEEGHVLPFIENLAPTRHGEIPHGLKVPSKLETGSSCTLTRKGYRD